MKHNPTNINYDHLAPEYARHRRVHPGILQALCEIATPDQRILEVGCGTANYTAALQSQPGRAWGLDPSKEMLHQARARSPQALLYQGRAEQLGLPACSFDLVFSVDVIHHLADPQVYYQEANRVLDCNGKVCTATDSEWIIRHRQPLSTYFPQTIAFELRRYPRIPDLKRLMSSAGFAKITAYTTEYTFSITDIQAYHNKAFSALQLIPERAFRRGIEKMERDLLTSPILCKSRYILLWGTKS